MATKRIKIVPDAGYLDDLYSTEPIKDKRFLYSFVLPVVERMYGEFSYANLFSLFSESLAVIETKEFGVIVKIGHKKTAENYFYIPFCTNTTMQES